MGYQYVKTSRHKTKERIIRVLGSKCAICGYNKCQSALEVHHIDPSEKEFTIAENTNKSYFQISGELKKCVLLCANCHREYHAGLIEEELQSSFNEEIDLEIKTELMTIKGKTIEGDKIERRCLKCGKEITKYSSTKLCPDCYKKSTRIVERPSREELKQMIRTLPFTKIAEQYGVTDNAIRKWCDNYELPRTKSDIKSYNDEDWEKI